MSLTIACLLVLSAVHLVIHQLRFLNVLPRSKMLSVSGGVAVAYVFLHILPQLTEYHQGLAPGGSKKLLYFIALSGLVLFYGMERQIRYEYPEKEIAVGDFWLHLVSFTFYNVLIGVLMVTEAHRSNSELLLFTFAIGLHFFNTDYGLWFDYRQRYPRYGRWLLITGLWLGWLLGSKMEDIQHYVPYLFAFLIGGIILNVMKEELPQERQSNFWAFLTGVAGYGITLWFL